MRILVRIALVLCLLVPAASGRAIAQSTTSAPAMDTVKRQLLRTMVTESHVVDLMLQSMQAGMASQRAANPAIPPAFWDRFLAAALERKSDLGDMVVEIYDRHFTTDELRQLLAFYHTPIGQKLLVEQPAIAQEAMAAGQQWGQRLGYEIGQKMAAEARRTP